MNQELIDEIHNATSMGKIMTAFNKVSSVDEVGEFIDIYGNDIGNRQTAIENLSFGVDYMDSPESVKIRLKAWKREQTGKPWEPDTGWDDVPPATESDPLDNEEATK